MRKILAYSFFSVIFFFITVNPAIAASISYQSLPSQTFSPQDEITLSAKLTITASDNSVYYLRGVFFKEGSSNYCGYTWNGTNYYKGPYTTNDGWKNFLKVTIKDSSWEGAVKVKIDPEDNGCQESGSYVFKLERFTESGSGSFDAQDSVLITFAIPSPTPTPEPTLKPTATPHVIPTKTPTPTKLTSTTQSQSTTTTVANEPQVKSIASSPNPYFRNYESSTGAVLAAASESADEEMSDITPTLTLLPVKVLGTSRSILGPLVFSGVGGIMLILCGILAFRAYKKGKI